MCYYHYNIFLYPTHVGKYHWGPEKKSSADGRVKPAPGDFIFFQDPPLHLHFSLQSTIEWQQILFFFFLYFFTVIDKKIFKKWFCQQQQHWPAVYSHFHCV